TVFARTAITKFVQDPRLIQILQEMLLDGTLAAPIAAIESASLEAVKNAAKLLAGAHRDRRMNLLKVEVLRSLLSGEARWIVGFIGPAQLHGLRQTAHSSIFVLRDISR